MPLSMDPLLKIARSATPESGVQFRSQAYGEAGMRAFLRDVIAVANASVVGNRYIVVGVDFDEKGRSRTRASTGRRNLTSIAHPTRS